MNVPVPAHGKSETPPFQAESIATLGWPGRGAPGSMSWEIWFTVAVVLAVLFVLATTPAPTEMVLLGAMVALSVSSIITPHQALSGFSSPGVMTIAAL